MNVKLMRHVLRLIVVSTLISVLLSSTIPAFSEESTAQGCTTGVVMSLPNGFQWYAGYTYAYHLVRDIHANGCGGLQTLFNINGPVRITSVYGSAGDQFCEIHYSDKVLGCVATAEELGDQTWQIHIILVADEVGDVHVDFSDENLQQNWNAEGAIVPAPPRTYAMYIPLVSTEVVVSSSR